MRFLVGTKGEEPQWTTRVAIRFAIFQAAFIAGVTAQKAASNALFLSRADPAQLPFLYVGVALVVATLTTLLARLLVPYSAAKLLPVVVMVESALLLALGSGVLLDVPFSSGALYVVAEGGTTAISILFWARVTDAFGARDQRRVVGLISAAGMAGSMIGGAAVTLGASAVGVPTTILVSALLAPLAVVALGRIGGKVRTAHRAKPASLRVGAAYLGSRGLPRAVAAMVVLLAATAAVVDYVFRVSAATHYDEVALTSVFGLLNAGVGVAAALFQVALTRRLLARFGVFWFAALVPFCSFLIASTTLALPAVFPLGLLFGLKAVEMMGAYSLNSTAITLLYNPMPENVRAQVRALIDGSIKKGGAALAGLTLVVLVPLVSTRSLLGLGLVLCAGVLALLPTLRRHYLVALDEKLGRRRKRSGVADVFVTDRETIGVLVHALESHDRLRVLVALRALAHEAALPRQMVDRLLASDDDEVRSEALRHLPAERDDALAERLIGLAHRKDAGIASRVAALSGLSRCAPDRASRLCAKFLDADAHELQLAAALIVLSAGEEPRARATLDRHVAAMKEAPESTKEAIASVLGALDDRRYDAVLVELLHDDSVGVRRQAIAAAGREQQANQVPDIVESLADAQTRRAAADALVSFGDAVVPQLAKTLSSTTTPNSLRYRRHLPRVLARIGTEQAAASLLLATPRDEAALQRTCVERLLEMNRKNPTLVVDETARQNEIVRRFRLAATYRASRLRLAKASAASSDAGVASTTLPLVRLLLEREDQALRLAHMLIGIEGQLDRAMAAYRGLSPLNAKVSGARRHQDALDLLELVLAKHPNRSDILRAAEEATVDEGNATVDDETNAEGSRTDAAHAAVEALAGSPDPLLRGIARRVAARMGLPEGVVVDRPGEDEPTPLDLHGEVMDDKTLDRAVAIAHTDLFDGLSLDDLAVIATITKEQTLAPADVLYRQGDEGDSLYIIQSGRIHLHQGEKLVLTLEEGESAGQVSFLDRGARPVTATVSRSAPATVLKIDRRELMDVFADRPALMQNFFAVVGARLRSLLETDSSVASAPPTPGKK